MLPVADWPGRRSVANSETARTRAAPKAATAPPRNHQLRRDRPGGRAAAPSRRVDRRRSGARTGSRRSPGALVGRPPRPPAARSHVATVGVACGRRGGGGVQARPAGPCHGGAGPGSPCPRDRRPGTRRRRRPVTGRGTAAAPSARRQRWRASAGRVGRGPVVGDRRRRTRHGHQHGQRGQPPRRGKQPDQQDQPRAGGSSTMEAPYRATRYVSICWSVLPSADQLGHRGPHGHRGRRARLGHREVLAARAPQHRLDGGGPLGRGRRRRRRATPLPMTRATTSTTPEGGPQAGSRRSRPHAVTRGRPWPWR